jgi:hypothetical protein
MSDFKTDEFNGVRLTEYNGKYSIAALRVNNDKNYPVWAKYRKSKDAYQEKDWPVKIVLGDKEKAVAVLKTMIMEIESGSSDIPF